MASTNTLEFSQKPECPPLSPEILRFSRSFPFKPVGCWQTAQKLIESFLPAWDRALYLCETYLENAGWIFRSISRQQMMDKMLPTIYRKSPLAPTDQTQTPSEAAPEQTQFSPHDLAVVLMVFAVGALVDLSQEPYNEESKHFYVLSKSAMTLQSIFEQPKLTTIQALHLMSIFNAMNQSESGETGTSMEKSWLFNRWSIGLAEIVSFGVDISYTELMHPLDRLDCVRIYYVKLSMVANLINRQGWSPMGLTARRCQLSAGPVLEPLRRRILAGPFLLSSSNDLDLIDLSVVVSYWNTPIH